MFVILEVQGYLPFVNIVLDDDGQGEAIIFDSEMDAVHFAEENCTWQYKIVEV